MGWDSGLISSLEAADLRALRAGPVLVYLLVANADGKLDKAEKDAFLASMKAPPTLVSLFEGCRLTRVMMEVVSNKTPHLEQLANTLSVLNRTCDSAGKLEYTKFLEMVGMAVAEASGPSGWLAFLQSNVSAEERSVMAEIQRLVSAEIG